MHRRTRALALGVAVVAVTSGCSGATARSSPTVLTVQVTGDATGAAYRALLGEYDRANRDVRIVVRELPADEARELLFADLGRSGLADVVTIDSTWLPELMLYSDLLAAIPRTELQDDEGRWPEWAVRTVTDTAGRVYAYPAAIAPRALCYDPELVAAAGLPADPAGFGALAEDWAGLLQTAAGYTAATGRPFLDSAADVFSVAMDQLAAPYEKRATGEVIATTNPTVRTAYERVTADPAVFAGLEPGTDEWLAAAATGGFAASLCAAGTIGATDPEAVTETEIADEPADESAPPADPETVTPGSGTLATLLDAGWEVADAFPGGGATSVLSAFAVPAAGAHVDRAREVADWLTAPEQQLAMFAAVGAFPSLSFADEETDAAEPTASATPEGETPGPDATGEPDPEDEAAPDDGATTDPDEDDDPFAGPIAALLRERAAAIPGLRFRGPETPEIDRLMAFALTRVTAGAVTAADAWDRWVLAVEATTVP
ncbi:extracellular solute-binding protein [Microbacterium sp. GXF7504]